MDLFAQLENKYKIDPKGFKLSETNNQSQIREYIDFNQKQIKMLKSMIVLQQGQMDSHMEKTGQLVDKFRE
jgi:hypothetical protein